MCFMSCMLGIVEETVAAFFDAVYYFADGAGREVEFRCGLVYYPGDEVQEWCLEVGEAQGEIAAVDFEEHFAFVGPHGSRQGASGFERGYYGGGTLFGDPEPA